MKTKKVKEVNKTAQAKKTAKTTQTAQTTKIAISVLVSTPEREKILGRLLERPSQKINMNGLARELGLSAGQIHKYVTILRGAGLVKENSLVDIPFSRALRLLWNLKRLEEAGAADCLRRRFPKATGIGVYGSWAFGGNAENSDLDLWVKVDREPGDAESAEARRELEKRVGAPADVVFATLEKLEHLRKKSDAFYYSLYGGIVLWGEGL